MIGLELMLACAPHVAPATLEQIIRVESAGNPLALNINPKWVNAADGTRRAVSFKPPLNVRTVQDAVTVTHMALEAGHSVDMGYMQVNSRHLKSLGYGVEALFEPCKNLAAGAQILSQFYQKALSHYPDPQRALQAALSAYNTGDFSKGFSNGYLKRYGFEQAKITRNTIPIPHAATTVVWTRPRSPEESFMQSPEKAKTQPSSPEAHPPLSWQVDPLISQSPQDAEISGVQIEHSAEDADAYGAFVETALSENEAWEANVDLAVDPEDTAILVNGKPVPKGAR